MNIVVTHLNSVDLIIKLTRMKKFIPSYFWISHEINLNQNF